MTNKNQLSLVQVFVNLYLFNYKNDFCTSYFGSHKTFSVGRYIDYFRHKFRAILSERSNRWVSIFHLAGIAK